MIRDAVLHLLGEQPLLVDLFEAPSPSQFGVLCTNVRTTAGKRPLFVDRIDSTFLFPYTQVRFVEIAPEGERSTIGAESSATAAEAGTTEAGTTEAGTTEPEAAEIDLDEDFLRRIREA
jgi:hypothetical protein